METKPIWQSKTFWLNALAAVSVFYPPVGAWVTAHPETVLSVLAGVNLVLRFITKGKVTIV